jgi:hypothetical protein
MARCLLLDILLRQRQFSREPGVDEGLGLATVG